MQRVLIVGASGGLGGALKEEAELRGAQVVGISRKTDGLDITCEASVRRVLGQLEGPFDQVIVATGALQIDGAGPEKAIRQIDGTALAAQFAVNAVGPALILKHCLAMLPRDRRAVFAALSARVGSIGDNRLGGWFGYRASKAALNQILRSASVEIARTHGTAICVALHPGTVATRFTSGFVAPENATPPAVAARRLLDVLDHLTPADSGGFFDYAGKEIPW